MKKVLLTLLRAVALIAAIVLLQALLTQMKAVVNQTFNYLPYMLCIELASILFGALLRSDIFFEKGLRFRANWLSLLLISLPCLLLASSYFILMYVLAYVRMPDFVTHLLWGDITMLFGGVAFGYTLINSLFTAKSEE